MSDDGVLAALFVDAMSGKRRNDLNGDSYIAGSEMGGFLAESVGNDTNNKQVARQGKLSDPRYDIGDVVFSGVADSIAGDWVDCYFECAV